MWCVGIDRGRASQPGKGERCVCVCVCVSLCVCLCVCFVYLPTNKFNDFFIQKQANGNVFMKTPAYRAQRYDFLSISKNIY